jgi:hypothetical protein
MPLHIVQELAERQKELEKRRISADATAQKTAIDVGFGRIMERFIPAYEDLKYILPLINSDLVNSYYRLVLGAKAGLTVNVTQGHLSQLPIKNGIA